MTTLKTDYLELYDRQLRTEAETPSALRVERLHYLRLATYAGGRGFITYPHVERGTRPPLAELVEPALAYFRNDAQIASVEFKTRAHDADEGLPQALNAAGFTAQEPESIMIGRWEDLGAVDAPEDLQIRRLETADEALAMCRMSDAAFGEAFDPTRAEEILTQFTSRPGLELWAAWVDGLMVGAGRLEPVAGTQFAGMWGGGVLPEYRGRGVYRALTRARARSALASGYRFAHSDSTTYSRPILEALGMLKVSSTTPYVWTRSA